MSVLYHSIRGTLFSYLSPRVQDYEDIFQVGSRTYNLHGDIGNAGFMTFRLESFRTCGLSQEAMNFRGGEWYLEKRGSRKILAGSRNLGSVFD